MAGDGEARHDYVMIDEVQGEIRCDEVGVNDAVRDDQDCQQTNPAIVKRTQMANNDFLGGYND